MPINDARRRPFPPRLPEPVFRQSAPPHGAHLWGFHPATWLALWFVFLLLLSRCSLFSLAVSAVLLVALAVAVARQAITALRRVRWILLSIILIYGWTTPGHAIWPDYASWSPTWEGVQGGAQQILRLGAAVIALGLLIEKLGIHRLFAGVDWLLSPLRLLRMEPERIAARLWLTLCYARQMLDHSGKELFCVLQENAPLATVTPRELTVTRITPGWRDVAGLLAALAALSTSW
jgi:hypothetical protein